MKLMQKILAIVAIPIILMIILGVSNIFSMRGVITDNEEAIETMEDIIFTLEKEIDHLMWMDELSSSFIFERGFAGQLDYRLCDFGRWYYDLLESGEYKGITPKFSETFEAIEEPHRRLHDSAENIMTNLNAGRREVALIVFEDGTRVFLGRLQELFSTLSEIHNQEKNALLAEIEANTSRAISLSIGLMVAAVVLSLLIGIILSNKLVSGVRKVSDKVYDIAEKGGDLTERIEVTTSDEVGMLTKGFNSFIESLQGLIRGVAAKASDVGKSCEEIDYSVKDIETALHEVATSVNGFAQSNQEISETVTNVEKITRENLNGFKKSIEALAPDLNQLIDSFEDFQEMEANSLELNGKIEKIEDILININAISQQTNMLALNASIEAARAGEHGRGFAVVADEVRSLAENSAEFSRQIEALLGQIRISADKTISGVRSNVSYLEDKSTSMQKEILAIELSVEGVDKVINNLSSVLGDVAEMSTSSDDISASVEEQSAALNIISERVSELVKSSEDLLSDVNKFKF